MTTFKDRLERAYAREQERRTLVGEPRLTKTELWKAAGKSSGAASHWFAGFNAMELMTCIKVAPVLRCNPYYLFNGSVDIDAPIDSLAIPEEQKIAQPLVAEVIKKLEGLDDSHPVIQFLAWELLEGGKVEADPKIPSSKKDVSDRMANLGGFLKSAKLKIDKK